MDSRREREMEKGLKEEFKGGVVSIGHGMDIILSLKYRRRSKEEEKEKIGKVEKVKKRRGKER